MESNIRKVAIHVRRNVWIKNITDRNGSGMSIKEWCSKNQVSGSSYYYWLKKIREEVIEATTLENESALAFVPLLQSTNIPVRHNEKLAHPIIARDSDMIISTTNMTVEFRNHTSQELILNVLKVLKNA